MPTNRREFLSSAAFAAAAAGLAGSVARASADDGHPGHPGHPAPPGAPTPPPPPASPASPATVPAEGHRPVVTPNGTTLPWTLVDGVKVYHLTAEPVDHEFAPGLRGACWGYNGRVHGPTIEARQGDRVRIYVTNRLPAPTTVHWHGLHVPNGMDGVGGLTQRAIEPGETFRYEFTLRQHGTFMYHSHHDEMVQMALGLMGMFVVHPAAPTRAPVDHDFVYLHSEWALTPGRRRPDPNEMTDFNVITLNARVFPGTAPMVVKRGDRVRIRIGNLSAMDHHPMHLHGHTFHVVETDGGEIPEAGRWPEVSVLVPVGSTRTIEFTADNPGDWAFHCHMTHHTMTQMGHGIPTLVGVDPSDFDAALMDHVPEFMAAGQMAAEKDTHEQDVMPRNSIAMLGGSGAFGYITMGGMFSMLKVRETLSPGDDAGWYAGPKESQADLASPEQMRADGIAG